MSRRPALAICLPPLALALGPWASTAAAPQQTRPTFRSGVEAFSLGLQQLAGTAGGGYVRVQAGTPDYAFARVMRETAAYYLLAVEPDTKERDGRLHFLRTTVKAKGTTVRARTHVLIPKK